MALALSLSCAPQVVEAVVDDRDDTDAGVCPDGGSDTDRDGDGAPDCIDGCPEDPHKESPALCGCGLPDAVEDGGATCLDLVNRLLHRYPFNGTGTAAIDSKGTADGNIVNASLSGQGTLVLAGEMNDQYVDLPNRILSPLGSVSLEAWVRWTGGPAWQRIFDFGTNNRNVEGEQGPNGTSYLFLTPRTPVDSATGQTGKLRLVYRRTGSEEVTMDAEIAMPSGVDTSPTQVVATVDLERMRMSLYIDGVLQNAFVQFRGAGAEVLTMQGAYDWSQPVTGGDGAPVLPMPADLTGIDDVNNWLGRSQYVADNELQGVYFDFRIYSVALTPEEVAISYQAGPDAPFLQ